MQLRPITLVTTALLSLAGLLGFAHGGAQKSDSLKPGPIPRTWDEKALATLELPLADPKASAVHVSADYFYRMRVRTIWTTYPIYAPGREPPGYIDWLQKQEAHNVFDPAKLKTRADWVRAGELVFDQPSFFGDMSGFEPKAPLYVREKEWYEKVRPPIAADGTLPFYRYVVREKGKVEVGIVSCGTCHTRVMPDGTVLKGAQGNFAFERANVLLYRQSPERVKLTEARNQEIALFGTPWLRPDPHARLQQMSLAEIADLHEAIPPNVLGRTGSSAFYPVHIPDLIGLQARRRLDSTGLVRHESIGDLMRYAQLNQNEDLFSHYGDFIPIEAFLGKKLPEDPSAVPLAERYSDEQLYALAQYLYSLTPPANPNRPTALTRRGQQVFARAGCGSCHTPPLYSNNMLTPAEGFQVPPEHSRKYRIMPICVGTDPNLALKTRRGTGYYKVPSLKGVWYRGMFLHDGSCATLEDLFDRKRLWDDYVPTGFKGYGVKSRAVKGHVFGLNLSEADRKALIAFLKTL
jgi:hypothetical protein